MVDNGLRTGHLQVLHVSLKALAAFSISGLSHQKGDS
jgi:hypothetical protein